jgi:hypothetical protein
MAKKTQKEYTIFIKRDVLFEATVKADTIDEALGLANGMTTEELWDTPGDIQEDSHVITAVFE